MLTQELKDELIRYATEVVEKQGIQALIEWNHWPQACGCMGARDGYTICTCELSSKLYDHLVVILEHFDPDAALSIRRKRLIEALKAY